MPPIFCSLEEKFLNKNGGFDVFETNVSLVAEDGRCGTGAFESGTDDSAYGGSVHLSREPLP